MREIVIGGAQMEPIQKAECREQLSIECCFNGRSSKCRLWISCFPELCLTTFFQMVF